MAAARARRAGGLWLLGYLGLAYLFIYLPVGVLLLFSFQEGSLPVPPFKGPTLAWYEKVLGDSAVTDALVNSLLVALGSSLVACLLGLLAAWALARQRLPGEGWLRALLTAPLSVSYLIIGLGLLIAFNALGFSKSLWLVAIGHVVMNLPLCFAILYSQMGGQQATIERAARDLGAREWQVLLLVTVPLVWPALFAAFFLSMTFSWDEFIIAFLLSGFEVTLPVEIWSMLRSGLDPSTNAVGSLVFCVSFLLVLALDLAVLRRWRRR